MFCVAGYAQRHADELNGDVPNYVCRLGPLKTAWPLGSFLLRYQPARAVAFPLREQVVIPLPISVRPQVRQFARLANYADGLPIAAINGSTPAIHNILDFGASG
jgi:hypothetical protein